MPSQLREINRQQQLRALQRPGVCHVAPTSLIVSLSLPLFSKVEPPLAFPREGCARLGWLTPIAAGPRVPAAAFTVRLRQSREPAFPVLAFDRLAGVKQGLLLVTEDAPMALQALTAVGEGIDGQADAMHASRRRSTGMKTREQRG